MAPIERQQTRLIKVALPIATGRDIANGRAGRCKPGADDCTAQHSNPDQHAHRTNRDDTTLHSARAQMRSRQIDALSRFNLVTVFN